MANWVKDYSLGWCAAGNLNEIKADGTVIVYAKDGRATKCAFVGEIPTERNFCAPVKPVKIIRWVDPTQARIDWMNRCLGNI